MKVILEWDGDRADLLNQDNGVTLSQTITEALDYASKDTKIYHNGIKIKVEREPADLLASNNIRQEWSQAKDREPIDYDIRDAKTDERYATVWGSNPWNDVQVDCEHPERFVEFTDDDLERGHCTLCGAECDWVWEKDEGNVEGYYWEGQIRVPTEWHGDNKGGIIGELINKDKERF